MYSSEEKWQQKPEERRLEAESPLRPPALKDLENGLYPVRFVKGKMCLFT